jgi:hypothetical protein
MDGQRRIGTTGTSPSGFEPPSSPGLARPLDALPRPDLLRRAELEDVGRQVEVRVGVAVVVAPPLQRGEPPAAVAGVARDDHLRRVLARDERHVAADRLRRVDQPRGLAELDRFLVDLLRLGVEAVGLPDGPGVLVGLLLLAEPEAGDPEALDAGGHDDLAPVVGHALQQGAERFPVLRGRERERMVALEHLVEEGHLLPALVEAPLEQLQPRGRRHVSHAAPSASGRRAPGRAAS